MRPLSEAECYVRLYGRDEDAVRVIEVERRVDGWAPSLPLEHEPPRSPSPRPESSWMSGEALRGLFEERLDSREPDEDESWAA
jgi:hypothetical protein